MNLKKIFGPSQKETWSSLAAEIGANFVEGGIFKTNKVVATEKEWRIVLDTFAVHAGKVTAVFTRMRAVFITKDSFRFKIYPRNFFSPIAKLFGGQDIITGYPQFDGKFVIQSNDEYKLRKLFANETIRELIAAQKGIHLEIKDNEGWGGTKLPTDADELHLQISGIIKDTERLKNLFRLFRETLTSLEEIGTASHRGVEIELK